MKTSENTWETVFRSTDAVQRPKFSDFLTLIREDPFHPWSKNLMRQQMLPNVGTLVSLPLL